MSQLIGNIVSGATLLRKIKEAGADKAEYTFQHEQLESSLPLNALKQWQEEVEAWERDPSKSNPFEQMVTSAYKTSRASFRKTDNFLTAPTIAAVRRELAEQEAKLLAAGQDYTQDSSVSPSIFISSALEIEAEQYVYLY